MSKVSLKPLLLSLASGDFNADSTTDLAVGAFAYSSSTGRVYIFISETKIAFDTHRVKGTVQFKGTTQFK